MPIIRHEDLPLGTGKSFSISRVHGRKVVTSDTGAQQSELWEQFQEPGGIINEHYHDVEEIITYLHGKVEVTIGGTLVQVEAPCTLFVPPLEVHSIRNIGNENTHSLVYFSASGPMTTWVDPIEFSDDVDAKP